MQFNLIFILIIAGLLWIVWRLRVKKLRIYQSKISGPIEIWQKYNGELVMVNKNCHHGLSIDDKSITKSYWFKVADQVLKQVRGKKSAEVLILGLGANTSSRIINQKSPQTKLTIVEFDPAIIQACRDYFHLNEMENLQLIEADAYKLINKRPDFKKKFDVIVVDIFIGDPPYISTKTNQPSYIEKLVGWLKKDGRMIFNRPIQADQDNETEQLIKFLKTEFKTVRSEKIADPRGYKNVVITADLVYPERSERASFA